MLITPKRLVAAAAVATTLLTLTACGDEKDPARCDELQSQYTAAGTGTDGSSFGDALMGGMEANSLNCDPLQ